MTYAAPRRALEELYDTQADPHQLRNLATVQRHLPVLERMRAELHRWQLSSRDAGLMTEPQMWACLKSGNTPWDVARDETQFPLKRFLEAASVVGRDNATHLQRDWLQDANDGMRYWAAVGLHAAATLSEADRSALREALCDSSSVVRIESAAALARHGEHSAAFATLSAALRDELPETVLHAARALELLGCLS